MAAQGHFEGQSINRPPLFDGEDYVYWKTRMEFFFQGLDYQTWSIVEEGDLLVTNEKDKWTEDDKKKISLNCMAKSILCCALSKMEFNCISAYKSAMEMWEKLRITYEGTDKVKETRIDILVTQYERFQMQLGESITQMYSRFIDITNGLAGLGKSYEMGDMVRKILRSLPASGTPKVTAIEEANDLKRMSLEKLIGSLMAYEINMERLGESSSRKKHTNALKAEEVTSEESSDNNVSDEGSEDEEALLSRRLQRILAKKKKYQSGRRYFKKRKDLKKPKVKDIKKNEPICYECKKPRHIKVECLKLKKTEFRKKDSSKKFRRYKKKVMAAAWDNSSDYDSESSSSEQEEEKANLAFMANIEEKITSNSSFSSCNESESDSLEDAFDELYMKTKLCGHKAVDVIDLEKNGMHSIVAAMERLKWTKMATLSESEEDGSLTSMVKGTQIWITHELLESLFGVSISGHSGVHTINIQAKGLGIVGPEFKLKDGKIDINQLNAFNRILHFIVCQILVPRSATFSTCTKADSDMMFWAIQNQSINMAEVILERMKFAAAQIWDNKSKLNVFLPYAHLLTKIFLYYGISVVGAVYKKMGQAIQSRNIKKSGFSLIAGVWTKTSAAEGEAIIGEALEVQDEAVLAEAVAAAPAVQNDQENARAEVPAIQEQQEVVREEIPMVQEDQAAAAAAAAADVQEIVTEVIIEAPVVLVASSGDLLRQGGTLDIGLHIPGSGVLRGSSQKPEWRCFGGFLALAEEGSSTFLLNVLGKCPTVATFIIPTWVGITVPVQGGSLHVVSEHRIEDIPKEFIEPVEQNLEVVSPSSVVASVLRSVLDSITSTQEEQEQVTEEVSRVVVALGHVEDVVMEEAHIQGEGAIC
ncbi:hypothetical protein Taro_037028 [Colocasia esculenta]|uniref:DUF4219 domain-containing protein n=1 Tax=Colocasia esculenta TaxID=4460 RepID=A0A843WJJ8_COLES|nr:hypothetical protein [Colocasia esculenta]